MAWLIMGGKKIRPQLEIELLKARLIHWNDKFHRSKTP